MEGNFKGGRGKKKDTEAFEAAVNKRARVHVLSAKVEPLVCEMEIT